MPTKGKDLIEDLRKHIDTGDLVLFVGNGVRRVPTHISPDGAESPSAEEADLGPSWQSYMESLWELVPPPDDDPDLEALRGRDDALDFGAFSRLNAPRQAEWFDRRAEALLAAGPGLAAKLRMHLLGLDLHPRPGIPMNPLLTLVAEIALKCSHNRGGNGVDLITTNVDCAIEQNIALALKGIMPDVAPTLIVRTAQGDTASWRRTGAIPGPEIRIWKIHGCLSALKSGLQRNWPSTRSMLARTPRTAKYQSRELAGAVPTVELWPGSEWRNRIIPDIRNVPSVFSMSEYISLLDELLAQRPGELYELFKSRPLLFIGYDLHEVDLDVVATLHGSKSANPSRYTLRFRAEPQSAPDEEERLRQMGVKWWSFQLGPLAGARLPGELRLTARHEWRYGKDGCTTSPKLRKDLDNKWRKSLQHIGAREWLEAQESSLRTLIAPSQSTTARESHEPGPRLVIAGLASMWHAFALKKPQDMPSRRRVSANLASVDSEVPGGSGLVPAMVAAAVAGPDHVGQITFLTNVTKRWSQWKEVEEFCLGGGIDIRPLEGDHLDKEAGARTSHVLLYDPDKHDSESWKPRQRMIMDVDELIDPESGGSIEKATAPRVKTVPGWGNPDHLLFADKLVSPEVLEGWQGPVVFETGSSGDELLDQTVAPAFWTAGFGSFIRTLVCARLGSKSSGGRWTVRLPQNIRRAAARIRKDPDLRILVDEQRLGGKSSDYVVLINSFGSKLWGKKGGVTHDEELEYGKWVQQQWHTLGDEIWRILDHPSSTGRPLVVSHKTVGRGILTTLHEAGLMAHLDTPDHGKYSVVIRIETKRNEETLQFFCDVHGSPTAPRIPGVAELKLASTGKVGAEHSGEITIPGAKGVKILVAERLRRHTLGAGDTVRGCLAYGLWALAFESRHPGSLAHVLFASCFLASLKSYTGSFVEFLRVIDGLRGTDAWSRLWGFAD